MNSSNPIQTQEIPKLVLYIRNACIPTWCLIIAFGLVGNVLTVALLSSPNLRRHSTSVYLRWLAVVDILYLLCSLTVNLFSFITVFPDSIRDKSSILCRGLPFLHYTLSYLSVWLLVAVTVDRMIWVVLPFHAKKICNHRNAFIVAVSLVFVFITIDCQFFFTLSFNHKSSNSTNSTNFTNTMYFTNSTNSTKEPTMGCVTKPFVQNAYPYIDLVILLILPLIFMVICNSAIIFKLRRLKKIRQTRLQSPGNNLKVLEPGQSIKSKKQKSMGSSSLTAMLLSINIFFVASITPLLVYDIVYFAIFPQIRMKENAEKIYQILFGVEQIVYTLWYLNFSAHFLLYCMSGPRFRNEATKLFSCKGICVQEAPYEAVTEIMTRRMSSHYRH